MKWKHPQQRILCDFNILPTHLIMNVTLESQLQILKNELTQSRSWGYAVRQLNFLCPSMKRIWVPQSKSQLDNGWQLGAWRFVTWRVIVPWKHQTCTLQRELQGASRGGRPGRAACRGRAGAQPATLPRGTCHGLLRLARQTQPLHPQNLPFLLRDRPH